MVMPEEEGDAEPIAYERQFWKIIRQKGIESQYAGALTAFRPLRQF